MINLCEKKNVSLFRWRFSRRLTFLVRYCICVLFAVALLFLIIITSDEERQGTNHSAIIGGYRAITIQCRWNLTSIADQNNDTRLRNPSESIVGLVSNSRGIGPSVDRYRSPRDRQRFHFTFDSDSSRATHRGRDEKCFYRASDAILPTMKGKTGREIDSPTIAGYT